MANSLSGSMTQMRETKPDGLNERTIQDVSLTGGNAG